MPATGVTVGDILLPAYDDQPADAYGTTWGLTALDGWYDGWEGSGTVTPRTQADGSWTTPQWATGRVVHISGTIEDTSWDGVSRAWDRLMVQLPFRTTGPMTVTAGEGTYPAMTAQIRQHEKPVLSERFANRAEFSLSVFSPDPRRYSTDLISASIGLPTVVGGLALPIVLPIVINATTVAGRVTVVNDGNEPTAATLTITGPCPPARITHVGQGRTIIIPDAVPTGSSLVIASDTRRGVLDGTVARTITGTGWLLDPGSNEIAFSASSYDPDALLTVAFRSAWR